MPRRTLRMRLALLYGGLFVATAVGLLALTVAFWQTGSSVSVAAGTRAGSGRDLAVAQSQHGADLQRLLIYSAIALAITALASIAIGWLAAGRILRPLRAIMASAQGISAANLDEGLGLDGPDDEFKELAATLDDLLGRLERSFESQRRFVANASHELRTPLSAERTLLQVTLADPDASAAALRSTCEQLLVLGEQQARLIEGLLTLATSERGIERWEAFDLGELTERVVLVRRQEAEQRGIRVETTFAAASGAGDPSLVESLVANLVDNAIRHNVDNGQVDIVTENALGICGPLRRQHGTGGAAGRGRAALRALPYSERRSDAER